MRILEKFIQERLIEKTHSALVIIFQKGLVGKIKLKKEADYKDSLSEEEMEELINKMELKEMQLQTIHQKPKLLPNFQYPMWTAESFLEIKLEDVIGYSIIFLLVKSLSDLFDTSMVDEQLIPI